MPLAKSLRSQRAIPYGLGGFLRVLPITVLKAWVPRIESRTSWPNLESSVNLVFFSLQSRS